MAAGSAACSCPRPRPPWPACAKACDGGELAQFTLATTWRMVEGWLLASLLGVALGALIGVSARARAYLQPTLEFVRPLPASALAAAGHLDLRPEPEHGARRRRLRRDVAGAAGHDPRLCGRGAAPGGSVTLPAAEPHRLRPQGRPAECAARHPGRHALVADGGLDRGGGRRDDRLAARPGPGDPARGPGLSGPASCSPASCCWG